MLLVYGSKFFVNGAVNIATAYGIPESVIGVSLVAFGTSLPELVVGVLSAARKKVDFALGNVLGSNIYNVLGVLGVSSFFGRFEFPPHIANFDLYVMTGVIIFITFYMVAMKKLGRLYGVLSLLVYTFYIGYMYI
jgi:cation:H+ antiporter